MIMKRMIKIGHLDIKTKWFVFISNSMVFLMRTKLPLQYNETPTVGDHLCV